MHSIRTVGGQHIRIVWVIVIAGPQPSRIPSFRPYKVTAFAPCFIFLQVIKLNRGAHGAGVGNPTTGRPTVGVQHNRIIRFIVIAGPQPSRIPSFRPYKVTAFAPCFIFLQVIKLNRGAHGAGVGNPMPPNRAVGGQRT